MRRLLALGVLVALSVSAGCASARPASAELGAAIDAASVSVGRVIASRCDAPPASGSAIAIGDDLVLTAAHVAENSRTVSVRFPGRLPVLADAIGEEPTRDLMLLRTREPLGLPGLELAGSPATTGDVLGLLGYPDAGNGVQTRVGALTGTGFTTSFRGADQQFLRLDAESVGGNSGGAVIDQAGRVQGLVVAVISSLRPSESSRVVTLAVPVADLAGQVSTWRRQPGTATTSVGQACLGEGEQRYDPPELTASGTGQLTAEASQLIWLAMAGWNAGQWQAAAQQYTDSGRADLGLVSDAPVVHWLAVEVSGVSGSAEAASADVRTRSVVEGHCRDERWRYQLRYGSGNWLIDSVKLVGAATGC
jgi:S1-C subfamily serine protease